MNTNLSIQNAIQYANSAVLKTTHELDQSPILEYQFLTILKSNTSHLSMLDNGTLAWPIIVNWTTHLLTSLNDKDCSLFLKKTSKQDKTHFLNQIFSTNNTFIPQLNDLQKQKLFNILVLDNYKIINHFGFNQIFDWHIKNKFKINDQIFEILFSKRYKIPQQEYSIQQTFLDYLNKNEFSEFKTKYFPLLKSLEEKPSISFYSTTVFNINVGEFIKKNNLDYKIFSGRTILNNVDFFLTCLDSKIQKKLEITKIQLLKDGDNQNINLLINCPNEKNNYICLFIETILNEIIKTNMQHGTISKQNTKKIIDMYLLRDKLESSVSESQNNQIVKNKI